MRMMRTIRQGLPYLLLLALWFYPIKEAAAQRTVAQIDLQSDLQAFVMGAYRAYQLKDEATLLSLHSTRSPYFAQFKEMVRKDVLQRQSIKIDGNRIQIIKADVRNNEATVRLLVKMDAKDADTGREAEGFPESDHTLHLVKEDGAWRLWHFVETADEFANNFIAANSYEDRANVITEAAPVTSGLRRGLLAVGRDLLEIKGDDTNAVLILNLVLKLSTPDDPENRLGALDALGGVAFAQGDYARAADFYQNVLQQCEKLGIKIGVAAMLTKMGNVHHIQGNDTLALELYGRSIEIYNQFQSKIEIAYPLAMIGDSYFARGNYQEATEKYEQSLRVYQQVFDNGGTAWLLIKLGDVYAAQRDNDRALKYYEDSLKLSERFDNKAMIPHALNGIAAVRYAQGRYAEVITLLDRAVALASEINAPEILWRALSTKGQTQRALGREEQAKDSFLQSIAVVERLRDQVVGNELEQQLFLENKTAPYNAMVELMASMNKPDEALWFAEHAKGRVLLDVLRGGRVDISRGMSNEERVQEKSLESRLTFLNSQWRRATLPNAQDKTLLETLRSQIENARLEYAAYETRIYAAHPNLKVMRGQFENLSLKDAGDLLPDSQSAFLEYVVTAERTYLFVLAKDNPTSAAKLNVYPIEITADRLTERIAIFRQRLSDNSSDFKALSRGLYDLLIHPADDVLGSKTALCIVPSEGLWELPFQALLSSSNRYLLENYAISYVPSLSILREMKSKNRREVAGSTNAQSRQLLALGNPLLGAPVGPRVPLRTENVASGSLPQSEREVRAIGEIYGPQASTVLTGAAAKEEVLKETAASYSILHFATHGVLDDVNPLYSKLLLAASSRSEDGVLEAREIMRLNLHADLVVLSACETARGKVGSGEGLIGMSWALFVGGASTTVASQWRVDSASTARLMVEFHRNIKSEKLRQGVVARALRKSALRLMSDPNYRHPFYWAGFVVIGDAF